MRAKMIYALLIATLFLMTGVAGAQLPIPANTQFDVTGFIQAATLDSQATTTDPNCKASLVVCGGSITVNHQKITVPSNTILQMPAAALTWQQVFALNPLGNAGSTGLAMADCPPSGPGCLYGEYEAHVVGNRVGGEYIAGLIFLSQHSLQSAGGFINDINYSTGELRVGGTMGSSTSGMRVRINDPIGRFGPQFTPDARFTIDENNPTVRSDTGYPMCIPRAVPPAAPAAGTAIVETDPLCPSVNRPVDPSSPNGHAMILTMATPAAVDDPANVNSNLPDPRLMAPFEVGDYVTYSGILLRDATGPYIAAYQMIGNVGLYTTAGVDPAYVATDVMLLGVGGTTVAGATEATIRTRFEGFTSDPSRNIVLSGVDVDACTGQSSLRDWGHIGVDPGTPAGAVLGRWRFRPPCKGADLASVTDKVCLGPAAGSFLPPTREMRSSVESFAGSGVPAPNYVTKNGLNAGAYQAPIFEFLFPENAAVGSPIVPNNFEDMPFLAQGSGPLDPSSPVSSTNPIIGQLSPWPSGFSAPAAPPVCAAAPKLAPVANAGSDQTVQVNAPVTLTAAASSDPNSPPLALTYAWAQTAGATVTLSDATAISPTFTAPGAVDTLTFQLTVTNSANLTSTANVTVTVTPAAAPSVSASSNLAQIASGGSVVLTATATGVGPFTYKWTQTAGPTTGTFTPATLDSASVTWSSPAVSVATPATFSVIATNGGGDSAPATVTVTVNAAGAPVIGAIASQSVTAGTAVTIPVTATSTNLKANLNLTSPANTLANFKINNGTKSCTATACSANWTVTFTAPSTAQTVNVSLTATDSSVTPNLSSAAANASVTVTSIAAPTNVSAGANQTVTSGANFTLTGSATGATSYEWRLLPSTTVVATTPVVTLQAPTVTVLPALVQTYELTAINAGGGTKATTTVTVVPVKDTVNITLAEYRTQKQRLTVDATSSSQALAVRPTLTMQAFKGGVKIGTLQTMPFNRTLNLYEVIVVGSQQPDSITVTSNYGGSASTTNITIRK